MCRYFNITKAFYKEIVTVYRYMFVVFVEIYSNEFIFHCHVIFLILLIFLVTFKIKSRSVFVSISHNQIWNINKTGNVYFNFTLPHEEFFLFSLFRDSKNNEVKVSGRAYRILSVPGVSLFEHPESSHNSLFVIIDPLKKEITVIKNSFRPYW